jgi:hypothetical protein
LLNLIQAGIFIVPSPSLPIISKLLFVGLFEAGIKSNPSGASPVLMFVNRLAL